MMNVMAIGYIPFARDNYGTILYKRMTTVVPEYRLFPTVPLKESLLRKE